MNNSDLTGQRWYYNSMIKTNFSIHCVTPGSTTLGRWQTLLLVENCHTNGKAQLCSAFHLLHYHHHYLLLMTTLRNSHDNSNNQKSPLTTNEHYTILHTCHSELGVLFALKLKDDRMTPNNNNHELRESSKSTTTSWPHSMTNQTRLLSSLHLTIRLPTHSA